MLHPINWQNFIAWLPLLFDITGNVFIVVVYIPACDVINFETFLSFLIKPFAYITKKVKIKM